MPSQSTRLQTPLQSLRHMDIHPSPPVQQPARNHVLAQRVFGNSDDLLQSFPTENSAWSSVPGTLDAVALRAIESALGVEGLVEGIVKRDVVEELRDHGRRCAKVGDELARHS